MQKRIIEKLIKKILEAEPKDSGAFEILKRAFSKNSSLPRNADIKEIYEEMVRKKQIKKSEKIEKLLLTRKIRTLSGVAVVAVLTKPYLCPGKCVYCPTEKQMPKSYLSNEPAVMRAILTGFHPYHQVQTRINSLQVNGHKTDKIELIVMGGTFSCLPAQYQTWFVKECFRAANDFPEKDLANKLTLEKEKRKNEKARNRIVGLTLETRPDFIDKKEIKKFRKLGATRVELGVQTVFDDILKLNNRGHLTGDTVKATKLLKDAGFKINYHLMPGLLGSSFEKDLELFKTVYTDSRFQPDMVKIYPCVVVKNSKLYSIWKRGDYKALSNQETKKLMIKIKKITPPYVRINRLVRDIPSQSIIAGPNASNLRQILYQQGAKCNCIRCREVKSNKKSNSAILDRIDYLASQGREIFLQFVSKNKSQLYALLRLRIANNGAIIREVHTYGRLTGIDKRNSNSIQHTGLGKRLIKKAEEISRQEFNCKKITVISGVGVRDYYRKLGYRLKDEYMVKRLSG